MNIKFFITVLLLCSAFFSKAQKRPSIKSSVTKNRVLLGEPFQLVVESDIPGGSIVRPVKIDTIPHFEFVGQPAIDTIREASGIRIKAVYTITSFDSGHWVIPSWSLSSRIRTDTIPIDVVFTEGFNPEQPYHDIKDIIAMEEEGQGNNWWYWIAGGALLLIVIAVLATRKKKKPVTQEISGANAYEEAMDKMQRLKKGKPGTLEYYSQMVEIFRLYVLKRKGIQSMQKTTNDLAVKLQSLGEGGNRFDRLVQALRLSDFVKFARYQPAPSDDEEAWQAIVNGIDQLEKLS